MANDSSQTRRSSLFGLFLISAGAVGFEIALTRYFSVAKWSEYGYWVISIAMVGFALSGVVMALFREFFVASGARLQVFLPAALTATAALGFFFTTSNPFNPLQLQNSVTWIGQVGNIAMYYVCLLPFFFLAGTYIALSFVMNPSNVGRVYGYDLIGAGAGAAATLSLMFILHPFTLVPALLLPLAASSFLHHDSQKRLGSMLAVLALLASEALLILGPQAQINDFKGIYAPLQTQGATTLKEIRSPRGNYLLLDDFTERLDTDLSNNAALMGLQGPPKTFGLYRDGNRIAAIPKAGPLDVSYALATLGSSPYFLRPNARVLQIGSSGGFRIAEALSLGARSVDVVEPEPILREGLVGGIWSTDVLSMKQGIRILPGGPVAVARSVGKDAYDLIDLSADFLDISESNVTALTVEAISEYLRVLSSEGVVSIPVSIKDFPVYALRMLATVRAGLLTAGIQNPERHVVVYRSAWGVRILVSKVPWSAGVVEQIRKFCDDRSFDISYFPGSDPVSLRNAIYNDLPSVSFISGQISSNGPEDAIANEAEAVLSGNRTASAEAFSLAPVTLDRPFFYSALRLSQLDTILKRLEILPQAEIGALINLAVLAQALLIALLVLLVPLVAPKRLRCAEGAGDLSFVLRASAYFALLGLGFLFIEIFLIERISFYLDDRTSAFALVLTIMLVFSGLGSMLASRFESGQRHVVTGAGIFVIVWVAVMHFGLESLMLNSLDWPWVVRAVVVLLIVAPVSLVLGMPFPMGLSQIGNSGFLPWAWGLNGAFSVVSTPLANLLAREAGFSYVLLIAAIFYGLVIAVFPRSTLFHPEGVPL